jgi:cell division protein FtsB
MTSVTLDLGVILTAFGAVVSALIWMGKAYEARLENSVKECQADNALQKETNEQLTQEIKELRTQISELRYEVGYLLGRKDANEPEPRQK